MENWQTIFGGREAALASRVAVYVPSTTDVNVRDKKLSARIEKETASALSAWFGGATVTEARGYWLSDAAGLIGEDVKIIYSNTTRDALDEHAEDIHGIAEHIKRVMKHEAVSVELDGALYFV